MVTFEPLDLWDRDISRVFLGPRRRVIKFGCDVVDADEHAQKKLENEAKIQSRLYERGFPVPKSFGLEQIKLPLNLQKIFERKKMLAHVSEYVAGIQLEDIRRRSRYEKILRKYSALVEEIRFDESLDLNPVDCGPHQVIVRPNLTFVFYDFENWHISR